MIGGVRTPDDLRARCTVLPSGCWRWEGARDINGRPSMWFPPLSATVSMGVAACWWATGARPQKGQAWHAGCGFSDCANPAHRVCGTRSSQMLALKLERTPQTRLRIAAARRKVGKLSDADVLAIRTSGMTIDQIRAAYGISHSYASEVRAGKRRGFAVASDVRVTQAATKPLPHEAVQPVPLFSALQLGSYLPSTSAIARSYGE